MNFFQKTVGVNRPLRERNWVEQKQRIAKQIITTIVGIAQGIRNTG